MLGLALSVPSVAIAEESAIQSAPVSIWYRNSADCPDGASFVEQLTSRGTSARLANVGDPVDFVVTLGTVEGRSAGRLERQTNRGTIAIRELTASSCDEIAQALALSLAVAAQDSTGRNVAGVPDSSSDVKTPEPDERQTSAGGTVVAGSRPNGSAAKDSGPGDERSRSNRLGTFGGLPSLATGVAPDMALGFGIFASYDTRRPGVIDPTLRFSTNAFRVASQTESGDFRVSLVTARMEACPLGLDNGSLRAESCAGLELGPTFLESTQAGGGFEVRWWSAALAAVRLRWFNGNLVLDAQAAAVAPFQRFRLLFSSPDSSERAYTTAAVGFQAGLGAGFRLP
jgi:hypothetical protein